MAGKEVARTDKQNAFLDALFGKAEGNVAKASRLAGYSKGTSPYSVVKALKEEIIERAEFQLALHSPRAVGILIGGLEDPEDAEEMLSRKGKIEIAKDILDRVGLSKKNKTEITGQLAHGIFILPPKDIVDVTPD